MVPIDLHPVPPLPDLEPLCADALADGFRLVRRTIDEYAAGANRFDKPGEVLLVAFVAGAVAGIGGLNIDPFAGDDSVGRVRHVYVHRQHRRRGVARALMREVLSAARGRFTRLHLRTGNPAAAALYEALGFAPVEGVERVTHAMLLPGPVAPNAPAQASGPPPAR